MTNSFSAQLWEEAAPIWEEIYRNPFLDELRAGTLPLEKFRYYMAQDYLYWKALPGQWPWPSQRPPIPGTWSCSLTGSPRPSRGPFTRR